MEDDEKVTSDEPVKSTVTNPEHANVAPEHTPPAVAPHEGSDAVREALNGLETRVTEVEGILSQVLQLKPDTTPSRKPWTHRKLFGG